MSDTGTPDAAPSAPPDDSGLPEVMGLRAASSATGIPITTLKRKHWADLEREGARKLDGQGYAIPLQALHALRLFDHVKGEYGTRADQSARPLSSNDAPAPGTAASTGGTPGTLPPGALDADQAERLRAELREAYEREAVAREKAAAAEAVAAERARMLQMLENGYTRQLESSQETIRLLEAKVPTPAPVPAPLPTEPEPPRRRGWFRRNTPSE